MSKGTKQQFKQFKIDTLEDAMLVLASLITPVMIDLEKFAYYSSEAKTLLTKYSSDKLIPAKEYDDVHDKILYQQRELLRFIADHQSSSFSYIAVRNVFVKKKFLSRELPEKAVNTLSELLEIRNWTFHNAQSMLVVQREIINKAIPAELLGTVSVIPQLNPVIVRKIRAYGYKQLESFVFHNSIRFEQFSLVLDEMKADYQAMFDSLPSAPFMFAEGKLSKAVQFIEYEVISNPDEQDIDIANLSMGIQKGKYDGSNEAFQKLIHK